MCQTLLNKQVCTPPTSFHVRTGRLTLGIHEIYRDAETNKMKGKFVFGSRKAATWTGYAGVPGQTVEEEV